MLCLGMVMMVSGASYAHFYCWNGGSWINPTETVNTNDFPINNYQENSDEIANSVGSDWTDGGTAVIDGNWTTGDISTGSFAGFNLNYTKPIGATGAVWAHSSQVGYWNSTIPLDCWNADPDKLILFISSNTRTVFEEGIFWNITCTLDSDCGFCEYCSAGTCIYQDVGNDVKDDCGACNYCDGTGGCTAEPDYGDLKDACSPTWDCGGYDSNSIYRAQPGNCLMGYCRSDSWSPGPEINVSDGNICILSIGQDVDPTIDYYCGIWSDCVKGETSAPEYFVGYCSGTCCDNDWQNANITWNAPTGYKINTTEQTANCSIKRVSGGGGSSFPETTSVIAPAPTPAPTFSLGGFLQSSGISKIWQDIKTWLASIGIKI